MPARLISCIVPVFNGELYLAEALDSILAQTYRPLDIIVADDGSTDGTPDVVAGYGQRVRYVWQPNAGANAARNLGLNAARGDFVAFLDADDLWHPEKLMRQMACFQARPELKLCLTHVQNFWVPELEEERRQFRDHRLSKPVPGHATQTLLARKSLFEEIGQFDAARTHTGDTEWLLRAKELGVVTEMMAEVLVHRRLHRTNLSRRAAAASRDEYLRLVKSTLDRRRRLAKVSQDRSIRGKD